MTSSSSSSAAAAAASDNAYAEAMHAILSSEPCRGLVTEPTRLLPHVFIGSQSNAEDMTTMRRLGVSHVLNCAGYKGPRPTANASPYDGLGIDYYEFKVWSYVLICRLLLALLIVRHLLIAFISRFVTLGSFLNDRVSQTKFIKTSFLLFNYLQPA